MCGIAGWVDFDRDLTAERPILDAMTHALDRRGPDAHGVWLSARAGLGHTRNAVIDLAGGVQPMLAEHAGRELAVLSYSGEVYNFRELRTELETRGHRFHTHGDTEVVLRAYLEWGEDCGRRLEGMFAFAVWDPNTEELLLVRDRLGIKPLCYAEVPGGLLFGSEPKALLANPLVRRVVDADGLRELFSTAKTPGQTVFRDLRELPPAHTLRFSRRGVRLRRYWQLEARPHTDNLAQTVGHVRELLADIVARELVADVPLCSLLSGGIDSSTITALATIVRNKQGDDPVRTITATFAGYTENFHPDDQRDTPDAPYAAALARHVGSEHTDIVLGTADLMDADARRAALCSQDMPTTLGDMDTSVYLMFRATRERATVALTGETSDEIFGGYKWNHHEEILRAGNYPWVAAESILAGNTTGQGRGLFDAGFLDQLDMPGYYQASFAQVRAETPHQAGEDAREHLMREQCYLHLARWLPMLLDRDDRLSMASGLEVRVPYCDHRLVEYVYNAPWAFKSFDGREKSLLRAAARDLLPESILDRPKSPYPVTQDPAYTQALHREFAAVLADPDAPVLALLDRSAAKQAITEPAGTANRWHHRMNIEMAIGVNTWLRQYHVDLAI